MSFCYTYNFVAKTNTLWLSLFNFGMLMSVLFEHYFFLSINNKSITRVYSKIATKYRNLIYLQLIKNTEF